MRQTDETKMDEIAKALFEKDGNPPHLWAAQDYSTQAHYRRKAQEVRREQIMQELADQAQELGLGY